MDLRLKATYICRGLLIFSSIIVIALSVTLHSYFSDDMFPRRHIAPFLYGIFTGAFGLIAASFGLAALFLTAVPWFAVITVDGPAAIFYVAGGSVVVKFFDRYGICGDGARWNDHRKQDICGKMGPDSAFMFFGFVVLLVLLALTFLRRDRRGKPGATV
ncbi:hypothetical protein LTR85_009060 [Meristemomyces frigidus]|nr:hypothetical protein LTR85_009060 [Meristemomyces frigidus]